MPVTPLSQITTRRGSLREVPHRSAYIASLPERVIRSLSALSGGVLREVGEFVLPASVRRTTLYKTMVDVALRFLIEQVGQVESVYASENQLTEGFLLKKGASHGIELLGILTFHASPIWVLAALADVAGGGRTLIREMSDALKQEGLIEPDANFETMDHLLNGLERTSAHLATTLNLPPINVAGLRKEWAALQDELKTIPPHRLPSMHRIEHVWTELQTSAKAQGKSVFLFSSLVAMSTVARVPADLLWLSRAARSAMRRTGKVLGEAVLDHYVDAFREIGRTGFTAYWSREFRPYLHAAAQQFTPAKISSTERILRRRDNGQR
jgi:hypothetical protein